MKFRLLTKGPRADYVLLLAVLLLTVIGLVVLASASAELGRAKYGDSYYYLKRQILMGFLPGLALFLVGFRLNYQFYKKIALIGLLGNILLLALVFSPWGVGGGGATRWLSLGPLTFQPAELLKISLVIYLAAWLANPRFNRSQSMSVGFLPFLTICGIVAVLLLLQPATSMVVILMLAGLTMYFASGAKFRYILLAITGGLVALALVIYSTPYRRDRLLAYFNPTADTQNEGYQLNQALIAIGSGGLAGIGYGQSTSKVRALPTPVDDSIFAVAAQELGFLGAGFMVVLFAILVWRLLWIARRLRDRFGQIILVGFAAIIGLQSFINMAAISGLIPLTGLPLPFVSYGGTALAVFLAMSGIALNVSRNA